jgi:hypothetical protein
MSGCGWRGGKRSSGGIELALSKKTGPERESENKVFHRKTHSLAQKGLTDNSEEDTILGTVTKTVINGVWEWEG